MVSTLPRGAAVPPLVCYTLLKTHLTFYRYAACPRGQKCCAARSSLSLLEKCMTTPAERVERLRQRMAELQVDALMITQDVSRYYLSGFYAHDDGLDIAGQLLVGRE